VSPIQTRNLAHSSWKKLALVEQIVNIGNEVERAITGREKQNIGSHSKAFERALELLDLTLEDEKNKHRLIEIARLREALVDYFFGQNQYNSTNDIWKKYFYEFAHAARRNCQGT
jgi:hypothetical protein